MLQQLTLSQSAPEKLVIFYEPGYPQACPPKMLAELGLPPYELVGAAELATRLTVGCAALVSFHGPYFPREAWPSILQFLESGGNMAIFGGMPFTRPVNAAGMVEPEQTAYCRQLLLGPFFKLDLSQSQTALELELVASETALCLAGCDLRLPPDQSGQFWAFYPKLTQVSDQPQDLGSAGPVDTTLTTLIFAKGFRPEYGPEKTRLAAPAVLLDQHSGRFGGGRWLISAWQPASGQVWLDNRQAVQRMIELTVAGVSRLEVRSALACYQPGEAPVLVVSARTSRGLTARLQLIIPLSPDTQLFELEFPPSPFLQEKRLHLAAQSEPGLYLLETVYQPHDNIDGSHSLQQTSGFWVWDATLVEAGLGQRLTAGRDYFFQGEEPFLVCGTTYMDSVIQRKFLSIPNPARWDRDFAEMKSAGINLIRTGLWTAWHQVMPEIGLPDEAILRALDAFVMTACKYNIQIIFNFFAFYPPLFGGENPWLDPRSIHAQQDFVGLLAGRYAHLDLLSWDLINEPSFGDPGKIFAQRPLPNYDRFELAAFRKWLQQHYRLEELQQRWQFTQSELRDWDQISLPDSADFSTSVRDNQTRRMYRAADYTHFSQQKFSEWASQLCQAIRAAGGRTLVGVGQDEAGVRIAPQYYADSLDYTTTHPWWNVDDQLWDMLVDKTLLKPNLIQETGVMLVTGPDGAPWRTEQTNADLLERKFMTALMARSAGVVQWLWHTNAYMTSDNENSIGLVRADGSAKPELAVMREFGRLAQALAGKLIEAEKLPQVWVVIPYSQWFLRPELGLEATQRCVRILGYDFGIIPQLVGEHQLTGLAQAANPPEIIILPGLQHFDANKWETLQDLVRAGSTLLGSGLLPAETSADEGVPVSRFETLIRPDGEPLPLLYEGEKIGYVRKAHNFYSVRQEGKGKIIWSGLPLELSSSSATLKWFYRQANGLSPDQSKPEWEVIPPQEQSPVLLNYLKLKEGRLLIAISESSLPQRIELGQGQTFELAPNRGGAVLLKDGQVVETFGGLKVAVPKEPGALLVG